MPRNSLSIVRQSRSRKKHITKKFTWCEAISQYLCSDHKNCDETLSNLWICDFVGIDVIRKLGRRLKNNAVTNDSASLLILISRLLIRMCGTYVASIDLKHRLTAYPHLFELPVRMNGMRRAQSDHACLDRLGWGRYKGKRDRTPAATSWFPLAWRQTFLVKGLDNCHLFQSYLMYSRSWVLWQTHKRCYYCYLRPCSCTLLLLKGYVHLHAQVV